MLDMDVNTLPRIYFEILKMFGICWNSTSFGRRKCAHDLGTGQKARLPWWKAWFLTSEGIPSMMKSIDSDFRRHSFDYEKHGFWLFCMVRMSESKLLSHVYIHESKAGILTFLHGSDVGIHAFESCIYIHESKAGILTVLYGSDVGIHVFHHWSRVFSPGI